MRISTSEGMASSRPVCAAVACIEDEHGGMARSGFQSSHDSEAQQGVCAVSHQPMQLYFGRLGALANRGKCLFWLA